MLIATGFKLAMAALAAPLALGTAVLVAPADRADMPENVVRLAPVDFQYRVAGDFSEAGKPTAAPVRTGRLAHDLTIMTRQVTAGEYAHCVAEGACPAVASAGADDRPMVGVSWRDAVAYAAWMTQRTGLRHRLPTDEEWVFAAGSKARDEALPLVDPADPAQAWIARYEAGANRAGPTETEPQPVGSFGVNEHGLLDIAGNVWEWTSTCFERATLTGARAAEVTTTNCGVRVVQGQHRSYMTDFIRDPRAGGCAAGLPPTHLGFRLVVDADAPDVLDRVAGLVRRMSLIGTGT